MATSTVLLHPRRDRPVAGGHPWVFSGAVRSVVDATAGDAVDVCSAAGAFLGRGTYNPDSQICVRMWTWQDEPVDAALVARRIHMAVELRRQLGLQLGSGNAFRLVNAEADLMPGLIVDVYDDFLVTQFLAVSADVHRQAILDALVDQVRPRGIVDRSDAEARTRDGLPPECTVAWGEPAPEAIAVTENGIHVSVDVHGGHKTGAYLDQVHNRQVVAETFRCLPPSQDGTAKVLNAFAYTGGFGLHIARANPVAHVLNLDSSDVALQQAETNFAENGLADRASYVTANAFEELRRFRDRAETFDGIVLDPPKFAPSKGTLSRARRGYKDLNLLAMKLLRPGGLLATFSCSSAMTADLFQETLLGAAQDAGRSVQILERLGHPPDHPVLLSFPQGEYLKGFLLRVL